MHPKSPIMPVTGIIQAPGGFAAIVGYLHTDDDYIQYFYTETPKAYGGWDYVVCFFNPTMNSSDLYLDLVSVDTMLATFIPTGGVENAEDIISFTLTDKFREYQSWAYKQLPDDYEDEDEYEF